MQDNPQSTFWIRRTRFLTQALIISGTLNIGLVATFAYFVLKEKQETLAIEQQPAKNLAAKETNFQLIRSYSLLPYQELLLRLENRDLIEEGLTKRDLSLACLVAFHHFNLDKALGGIPLQKRTLLFTNQEGQETIDLPVFPGLADYQFQAILQYAKTEKWPLTSQGLYYELKRSPALRDLTLLDSFYLTPEYHAVGTLFSKSGLNLTREQVIDLICDGEWSTISSFTNEQRTALDLSPDRRRTFLVQMLEHSKLAAKLLLDNDRDFVLKRLGDAQILALLDLYPDKTPTLEAFAKELLASPRTDTVCKRAAALLYTLTGEPLPEPYSHAVALQRFLPQSAPAPQPVVIQQVAAALPPPPAKKKMHVIEQGDNLWKIARKYKVSVEEIKRVNHLETEKLRPGKQLEIPNPK